MLRLILLAAAARGARSSDDAGEDLEELAARVTDDFAAALDVDPDAAANAPNTARARAAATSSGPRAVAAGAAPRVLERDARAAGARRGGGGAARVPRGLRRRRPPPGAAPLHAAPWATPYALSIYGSEQVTDGGVGDGYGDGRAASLFVAGAWEAQLKGSGPTPFRRRGDGFAVVRSSTREFLASEAMAALGVPTTRALALCASASDVAERPWYSDRTAVDDDFQPVRHGGDVLRRERRAITTRVARASRVGSLELSRGGSGARASARAELEALFRYAYDRRASARGAALEDAAVAAATETRGRFASLACHWLRVGYAQSNYNSDNSLVGGATVDYGPSASSKAQADSEAYFRRAPDDAHLTGGVGWMS
ncbi:hypothetical protein JL720_4433 [Aureococcus anophagefferens]|nr:hypothetical protein JL720_4433 [Aureococcus anophagefferens]